MTIYNMDGLKDALRAAAGGETLRLAAGEYGNLAISERDKIPAFYPPVTLTSADPDNRAIITSMDVRGVTGLHFEDILFDYNFKAADPIYLRPFQIGHGSDNVVVRNCEIAGDVAQGVSEAADGYAYASGFAFRDCTNVTFEGNNLHTFYKGLIITSCDGVTVHSNDIHSMRMDATNFASVQNVLIEDNHIHSFRGSPVSKDHCDMIQFWTNGTKEPSCNIEIRNNRLDIDDGYPTQSIFMRNEKVDTGRAGPEMFYRDIVIEDNIIINGHLHGITVGETDGLVIRNNRVLHSNGQYKDERDSRPLYIPTIRVSATSRNVVVTDNVTGAGHTGIIPTGYTEQEDWRTERNTHVQTADPNKPGYYADPLDLLPSEPAPVEPESGEPEADEVQIGVVVIRGGEMILRLDAVA